MPCTLENRKVVKETVIGSNGAVLQTLTYTYYRRRLH